MQFLETILPAHFTRRNRIIFILAILFSIGSFVALIKVQPKDESQTRTMLATLVDQNQYVTRKFNNSLSFIEIDKGEKLFNGDQIFTGENSTAKVVFQKSGNILNIPPRGLVKIEETATGENVDIQKGLAEFVIQKGQSMNITQGTETITLKTSDTETGTGKIFFNDKKIVLQVDSGQISLNDTKGKVQEVKKNETVSLEGESITKFEGVTLTAPVWGQKIDIWQGLTLEWTNVGAVDAVIAKDENFTQIIGKITAQKSPYNWTLPLNVGQYFIMVKPAGKKNKDATTFPLEMFSAHNINSLLPADDSSLSLKRGEGVKLSWNEVPAQKYRVTINDQDGRSSSYLTSTPELVIPELKGSSIDWSVAPQLKSGVFLADTQKSHLNFIFDGQNNILSPKTEQMFIFGKDKPKLSWSAAKNERTHVKISNNNQVIKEMDTLETSMEFSPEAPGVFTLEVASKDYPSANSAKVNFSMAAQIADWETNAPIELSAIDPDEKKVELKFKPYAKDLNEIEVSIFGEKELKTKIATAKVLSTTIIYTVKRFGDFCFVLRPANKSTVWLPSAVQCITYKQLAPFDGIAATKNIILKYKTINGTGSYLITLPVVPRAETYEIQVFDNAKNVVFSDRSKENVINWPSSKTGIYYYKYRVVDSKGRASDYSAESKLIFPISPLTDWQE